MGFKREYGTNGNNGTNGKHSSPFRLFRILLFGFFTVACCQTVWAQSPSTTRQPNPSIEEAVASFERGDLDRARQLFKEALSAAPKNTTALAFLGLIADRSGNLAEAEAYFGQVVKLDPDQASARNNYGAILLKLGRRREATEQFEASLRLDNRQLNALANLAQLRAASGVKEDLRAALELLERAAAISSDAEITRAMTVIALRLGEREAAARYYKDYSRLLTAQASPPTPEARAELGAALSEAALFSEAVAELTAAVQAAPSNAETIFRLAKAYIELRDLPGAGRTLESAIARGVETGPLYALLSSVYEKTGHIERAIPAMRLAIEREPQSEQRRFEYGMLLTNAMAPAAAVIRLEESLRLFPNSSRLWFALGIARFKQNQNEEAAQAFARAVELDRKFAAPLVYLGMTYVEKGQYEEAVNLYEQALAINSDLGIVDYLIANALTRESTADSARIESRLLRAIRSDPTFAPARLSLAKLHLRANRLNEARTELERVIALDANLAEAHYQLGLVYSRLRKMDDAKVSMARFKQLSDSEKEQAMKERKEIIDRLSKTRF
ncbi:MAG TPA: tetratricopeptide repeat protein [Blastocatellia bacterium]|nr:tetratricopeptide repeat protein [Blastocatellia bacterium]